VRITRIYEGTSEIMEMTIARGRWQEHLKTRGDHYHAAARQLESLHTEHPAVGADVAALAHHALAELMETARVRRLTRHQHVLLRLGALIARVEGAAALARRAARADSGELGPKSDRRLDSTALATASRVNAREVALTVATEGVRWAAGADGGESGGLESKLATSSIHRAQAGLLDDMDALAQTLCRESSDT
jgi:alkylation response protein AidB-like acyl-CoA dehydrogenase